MKTMLEHRFICRDAIRFKMPGWLLTESLYPPHLRMVPHQHENAYFSIVLRGSYSENNRGKPRVCGPSTLVLHPEGNMHSVQFHTSPTRIFRVELKQIAMEKVRQCSKVFDSPEQLSSASLSWLMTRLHKEFLEPDDVAPLSMEGLILDVLAEASRAVWKSERNCPLWLRRALEFLHENFDKPFCLNEIAGAADVHPAYLAREFRRRYRTTMGEYVRKLRVEAACHALSSTDAPLSEIAASLGFSDQSHLGRQFRRMIGLTPAKYRAAGRRAG